MKTISDFSFLLPSSILFLQAFMFLYISLLILKRIGMLKQPYNGLEYSQAIFASVVIFSVLLINTACLSASFQTFKIYQNHSVGLVQSYLSKSAQFFFIVLLFELILGLITLLFIKRSFLIGNGINEIREGSINCALLTSCIILGFAIVLRAMASEIIDYVTPKYFNFR